MGAEDGRTAERGAVVVHESGWKAVSSRIDSRDDGGERVKRKLGEEPGLGSALLSSFIFPFFTPSTTAHWTSTNLSSFDFSRQTFARPQPQSTFAELSPPRHH